MSAPTKVIGRRAEVAFNGGRKWFFYAGTVIKYDPKSHEAIIHFDQDHKEIDYNLDPDDDDSYVSDGKLWTLFRWIDSEHVGKPVRAFAGADDSDPAADGVLDLS